MAFRFRNKSNMAAEFRRLILAQNRKALALLRDDTLPPARRVHQARRCFKRMRAAFRLIRPAERYVYTVENRHYRDLGRKLARVRDSVAIIETVDRLAKRVRDPAAARSLEMLRDSLRQRSDRESEEARGGVEALLREVADDLERHDRVLQHLPVADLSRKALRKGKRRNWKQCRRRYEQARSAMDDPSFHDWRKSVKYAYYHSGLLRKIRPRWSSSNRRALKDLGSVLGHLQDLAVLDNLLEAQPDALGIDLHLQRLRRLMARSRTESREQALRLGERLFGESDGQSADEVTTPLAIASGWSQDS